MDNKIKATVLYDSNTDKYSFKLGAPLAICWQVTKKCNMSCKYCLSSSSPTGEGGVNTKDALNIIDQLGSLNVKRLDFTGGEPLLREDLEILLKEARKKHITSIVTTNTLLLDEKKIRMLKKYASIVQVSIDGHKNTHNTQRGSYVFDKTIKNVKKLIKAGCKVRLNSFICKSSLKDVNFLLHLSKKLKVYSHLFILFSAQGRGRNYPQEIIPREEAQRLKERLALYGKDNGFYIRILDYGEHLHSCVLINNKGEVITQGLYEEDAINLGNALTTPIKEIFKSNNINHLNHLNHYVS